MHSCIYLDITLGLYYISNPNKPRNNLIPAKITTNNYFFFHHIQNNSVILNVELPCVPVLHAVSRKNGKGKNYLNAVY